MAARKPVTTDDVAVEATADDVPVETFEDRVAAIDENTADDVRATADDVRATVEDGEYVKVKSPFGDVTTVPVGILDALLESGYSKSK